MRAVIHLQAHLRAAGQPHSELLPPSPSWTHLSICCLHTLHDRIPQLHASPCVKGAHAYASLQANKARKHSVIAMIGTEKAPYAKLRCCTAPGRITNTSMTALPKSLSGGFLGAECGPLHAGCHGGVQLHARLPGLSVLLPDAWSHRQCRRAGAPEGRQRWRSECQQRHLQSILQVCQACGSALTAFQIADTASCQQISRRHHSCWEGGDNTEG